MESQAQSNKDLINKNIGIAYKRGDINLVSKRGGSKLFNMGLSVFIAPFYKI